MYSRKLRYNNSWYGTLHFININIPYYGDGNAMVVAEAREMVSQWTLQLTLTGRNVEVSDQQRLAGVFMKRISWKQNMKLGIMRYYDKWRSICCAKSLLW